MSDPASASGATATAPAAADPPSLLPPAGSLAESCPIQPPVSKEGRTDQGSPWEPPGDEDVLGVPCSGVSGGPMNEGVKCFLGRTPQAKNGVTSRKKLGNTRLLHNLE